MDVINASSAMAVISFWVWPNNRRRADHISNLGFKANLPLRPPKKTGFDVRKEFSRAKRLLNSSGTSLFPTVSVLLLTSRVSSAIAFEEGLQQEELAGNGGLEGAVNAVAEFLNKYPFFVFGVSFVWLIVVPVITDIIEKSKRWSTAEDAYSKLKDDLESQLLDIRPSEDIRYDGSPDLGSFNVRVVQVSYAEGDESFLQRVLAKFKEPANTTLYILDTYDGNSMTVAKLLADNGFKAAYAIKDGFQGKNGWQAVGKSLVPKAAHVATSNAAAISQDQKADVPVVVAVNAKIIEKQTTETLPVPSSFSAEVGSNLAPQQRPLSPYPRYPDLKPPSSPTPSKP